MNNQVKWDKKIKCEILMKKVALVFSSDYELFGDGSGNVNREQIQPTDELVNILSPYDAKLTIMFEYAQYCIYEKFSKENIDLKHANEKIKEQLINLVKKGHDVQLHYHAQWRDAKYNGVNKQFNLDLEKVDISCLEYDEIVSILKEGKRFLETLLKPYKSDYECVAFRAGSWAVKNEKKLAKALQECGFKLDSSVVPNAKFESEHVNFEYHNSPYQYHYWHCHDDLSTNIPNGKLIELPIYTKKSHFAAFKYLNKKYAESRKVVKALYTQKISEVNFSLYEKVKKVVTRNYYMADINTMDYKTLISMLEDVIHNDKSNRKVIPIMFIAHSKVSYYLEDLKLFFYYLEKNYPEKIEYWTLQETVENIENGLNENREIVNITDENDIQQSPFVLPILGEAKYLETKSDEYGWFVSKNFVLPYYIDKKSIFSRLVFSTNIISTQNTVTKKAEKLFLDSVVMLVKEKKLCDFIYKAQSNVVFDVCPRRSTCVPWGTYIVDLAKSEEELFTSFNSKARNAIRKAIKEGVSVSQTQDVYLIYENIKETLRRQSSVHYPSLEYIQKLHQLDNAVFLVAKHKESVQGTLILLYDKHRGYAMYAGSIQKPVLGSLDLLHYEAMKFLQSKNIPLYDFVGTRLNIKKGSKQEGIDRFKRKFNPQLEQGFAFRTIVRPFKFYMYFFMVRLYFRLKDVRYTDPITEIMTETNSNDGYLLLLGPRYNTKNAQLVGGPIVLFEELIDQLKKNQITFKVIDTNKQNHANVFVAYLRIMLYLTCMSRTASHISLHSSRDYRILGVIVIILSKLHGKKSSLRKFGGEARDTYMNSKGFNKKIFTFIFTNFDYLFMETRYLVSFFKKLNSHTSWFPNVRNRVLEPKIPRSFERRFVFISHVIQEKGVREIIEVANQLDDSYTVDIYGPLIFQDFEKKDFDNTLVNYKGALSSDRVLSTLNQYDVVLLPSYKEGYPGIVIEAYSLGMPVITTNLDSISEIVDDYKTGILVTPKNVEQLRNAIEFFNEANYVNMSQNAYEKFNDFKSDVVTKKFIEIIDAK